MLGTISFTTRKAADLSYLFRDTTNSQIMTNELSRIVCGLEGRQFTMIFLLKEIWEEVARFLERYKSVDEERMLESITDILKVRDRMAFSLLNEEDLKNNELTQSLRYGIALRVYYDSISSLKR